MANIFHFVLGITTAFFINPGQTKSDDSELELERDEEFRIVGGTYAIKREFPFMVSLQTPLRNHSCGGVILTASEILTAAHCCLPSTLPNGEPTPAEKLVYATAGHVDLNRMSQTRVIQSLHLHADWEQNNHPQSDLCIVKLKRKFKLNKSVQKVKVKKREMKSGRQVVAAGWGKQEDKKSTDQLLTTRLTSLNYKKCEDEIRSWNTSLIENDHQREIFEEQYHDNKENLSKRLSRNVTCTVGRGNRDTCFGDSGGAIVTVQQKYLVGIVSSGLWECGNGLPGINTNVPRYIRWIKKQLKKLRRKTYNRGRKKKKSGKRKKSSKRGNRSKRKRTI